MNVMMFNTSELILDAVILSIVASTPEGISGFKIVQNVRSKIDVPENTFYPLLKQMQADGYLEVYHKDIGGRSRRFYKITDAGREHLTYCQQTWNSYLQGASSLLMNGAAQPADTQPQVNPVSQPEPSANVQPQINSVPEPQPVPVMNVQPQINSVPEPQTAAPGDDFHIGGSTNNMMDFEFSIGDDDSGTTDDMGFSSDGDLFEFDNIPASDFISYDETPVAEPVSQAPVMESQPVYQEPADEPAAMEQPPVVEPVVQPADMQPQPVYQEPADEPAAMEQPPVVEPVVQPADMETSSANEPTLEEIQPVTETADIDEDDEADFLAEMAMGDSDESEEEELPELESSMSDIATINELENMLTQLRSFESVMKTPPKPETAADEATQEESSPEQPSGNLNLNDINAVAAMLNPAEAEANNATAAPVRYAEVRNKETDDSVNSLVDLLKDDDQPKKRGFFGRNKKKNIPKEIIADTPRPVSTSRPIVSESSPIPVSSSRPTEVRNPESDDSVNSLVDLLKDDDSSKSKRRRKSGRSSAADEFRATAADISAMSSSVPLPKSSSNPVRAFSSSNPIRAFSSSNPIRAFSSSRPVTPKPEVSSSKPVSRSSYREVPNEDAVGGLVDLLKDDKAGSSTTPKIFKQKNYTKVSSSQPLASDSSETPVPDAEIPDPSVSEPKVYKPAAAKSFEEKAASPNAKPVETTATITKPLEAKAISTKPTEAKPVEAKSVETKAVVTPKPEAEAETAPASEEQPQAEAPMDDFKRRLMMAHLIPEDENKN